MRNKNNTVIVIDTNRIFYFFLFDNNFASEHVRKFSSHKSTLLSEIDFAVPTFTVYQRITCIRRIRTMYARCTRLNRVFRYIFKIHIHPVWKRRRGLSRVYRTIENIQNRYRVMVSLYL